MVALTWLRGLRRPPPRPRCSRPPSASPSASRCSPRSATFLSATTAQMTDARDRARAGRLAGRGPAAARAAAPCSRRSRASAGVAARAAGRLRRAPPGSQRHRPAARRRRTGPGQGARAARRLRAGLPGELRTLAGRGDRRAARPADGGEPARAAGRHVTIGGAARPRHACASTASSTCRPPTRCSSRSARRSARSRRRRPTTSSCCPQRARSTASSAARPVTTQVHARARARACPAARAPPSPQVSGHARNLETRLAGSGRSSATTSARRSTRRRQDALYAQLLFLFLGVPGAILAGLVTASIAAAGADRRRRDAALLRTRGASTRQLVRSRWPRRRWPAAPASRLGLGGALLDRRSSRSARRASAPARSPPSLWAGGAALAGLAIAAAAIALPAWRDARGADRRRPAPQRRARATARPWWARYGLDVVALAGAGARLLAGVAQRLPARARARGRPAGLGQLVRAAGAGARAGSARGLLAYRLADLVLRRGAHGRSRGRCARSPASSPPTVAATMGRQRRLLAARAWRSSR